MTEQVKQEFSSDEDQSKNSSKVRKSETLSIGQSQSSDRTFQNNKQVVPYIDYGDIKAKAKKSEAI